MDHQPKQIEKIKLQRKMKQISNKLNQKDLEDVDNVSEDENFVNKIKSGENKFTSKTWYKYDEFGTEFTAFNMDEELEEGNIDDEGHFIRNKRNQE
jgi:hypothetical protein